MITTVTLQVPIINYINIIDSDSSRLQIQQNMNAALYIFYGKCGSQTRSCQTMSISLCLNVTIGKLQNKLSAALDSTKSVVKFFIICKSILLARKDREALEENPKYLQSPTERFCSIMQRNILFKKNKNKQQKKSCKNYEEKKLSQKNVRTETKRARKGKGSFLIFQSNGIYNILRQLSSLPALIKGMSLLKRLICVAQKAP